MRILAIINIILVLVVVILYVRMRKYKSLLVTETENNHQDIEDMRRQILYRLRPHFMFNVLSGIRYMAKKNPDAVYDLTLAFSKYLRGNIESLVEQDMVSFEQELDHVKAYIKLEQIHKSDRVRMVYEIRNNDFFLPRRVIEALVENAVKHGISSKAEGGTIWLRVQQVEWQYEILVEDDGVGFDVNTLREEKYRGFHYVRTQLETMPNSDMRIESTPGGGTRVSLRFCSIED